MSAESLLEQTKDYLALADETGLQALEMLRTSRAASEKKKLVV